MDVDNPHPGDTVFSPALPGDAGFIHDSVDLSVSCASTPLCFSPDFRKASGEPDPSISSQSLSFSPSMHVLLLCVTG